MDIKKLTRFIERKKQKRKIIRLEELRQYGKTKTKKGNPVAYKFIMTDQGGMSYCLTTIYPGFFTRGHKHKHPYPEIYIPVRGKLKLILKNGKTKATTMEKGKIYFIPGGSWHRTANIGKKKASFISLFSSESGHIYK